LEHKRKLFTRRKATGSRSTSRVAFGDRKCDLSYEAASEEALGWKQCHMATTTKLIRVESSSPIIRTWPIRYCNWSTFAIIKTCLSYLIQTFPLVPIAFQMDFCKPALIKIDYKLQTNFWSPLKPRKQSSKLPKN
jgi:hypothetical protein